MLTRLALSTPVASLAVSSILATCIVIAAGCSRSSGGGAASTVDPTRERLLIIGRAYKQFNSRSGKPPKQTSDLLPTLKTLGFGEETFTSLRDGQPIVVCWNVDVTAPPTWAKSRPILAYETSGQDGSRYIVTAFANVELLSSEQFMESSFPPGYGPGK